MRGKWPRGTRRRWAWAALLAVVLLLVFPGCAVLLGDFSIGKEDGGGDDSSADAAQDASSEASPLRDATPDAVTADDSGSSGDAGDAGDAAPPPAKPVSASCTSSSECLSNTCADGVCCQTQCNNSCKACNVPGQVGICADVPAGASPPPGHATCSVTSQSSCGQNGTCDGAGQCALWNKVVCQVGSCDAISNQVSADSKCNGQGVCVNPTPITCAPYLCDPTGTGCYATCTGTAQCVAPNPCVGGSCGPKANGTACTSAAQCTSGNCVDGYCCDLACAGQCQACDLTATPGTCSTVKTGEPHGTRAACAGSGACQGACLGGSATGCAFPDAGTECSAASCTGTSESLATGCNGAGACPTPTTQSCGNYTCGTTACLTACTSSAQCVSPTTCNTSGQCTTPTTCFSGRDPGRHRAGSADDRVWSGLATGSEASTPPHG